MSDNEYLPYKTINIYIERDFLKETLEYVIQNINTLPKENQIAFGNKFREYVTILGFRNPMRAPLPLQVNAFVRAFEDMDEVIPFTLSTWANLRHDFAVKVKDWLTSEGWKDLNLEREFDEREGFVRDWHASVTFESLIQEFEKAHPGLDFDEDDLILMILWISGKLPDKEFRL